MDGYRYRGATGALQQEAADMLGQAARLSEALRARASKPAALAWAVDSAAALIRRHQNGGSPVPNGTLEERAALSKAIQEANAYLSNDAPSVALDASAIAICVIDETAKLIAGAKEGLEIAAAGGKVSRAELQVWLDDASQFAICCLMAREVLGGSATLRKASAAISPEIRTMVNRRKEESGF